MSWPLHLELDDDHDVALYLRIADALSRTIVQRRLQPGEALPSSRRLAKALSVNRNTVVAAFDELAAQGWITSATGRGTFVADAPPSEVTRRRERVVAQPLYEMGSAGTRRREVPNPLNRVLLPMGGGLPDLRLLPTDLLSRAYRRVLRRDTHGRVCDYGDPRGHSRLRAQLVEMLGRTRGLAVSDDELLITRGSQMAIDLIARQLIRPGERVAVESIGYEPAWNAFRSCGARLDAIPVDDKGIRIDCLEKVLENTTIRAVYLTPHHQYPTTVTLNAKRRERLLVLARRYRFAIIEDDYDNEIHYEGTPALPLAAVDGGRSVVYVGSLSKIFAPHLRLGFAVAPRSMIDRLARRRAIVDGGGDSVLEIAVSELFEDDEVQRHARRIRRVFRARREALLTELHEHVAPWLTPRPPPGGMALWSEVHGVDPETWARAAAERGVLVSPGRRFRFDGRRTPHMRIGFAACDEQELATGVRMLKESVRELEPRGPRSRV